MSVWLVDHPGANAQPHFVVDQAARMVLDLRKEGRAVLLHCAAGQSRTPAIAARYTTLTTSTPARTALAEAQDVTPLEWLLLASMNEAHAWTLIGDLNERRSDQTLASWTQVLNLLAVPNGDPSVRRLEGATGPPG